MAADAGAMCDSSVDDAYDSVREAIHEYRLTRWFSTSYKREWEEEEGEYFEEEELFNLSLLEMTSIWKIEKSARNEYTVKRKLEFSPVYHRLTVKCLLQGGQTTNWSITVNITDMIIGDNRAIGKDKKKERGPHKEFSSLTATNEKPYVEFEYIVKETQKVQLFSYEHYDYFCSIHITVVDCRNLSGYLNKCVDFSQPFPASNVILEIDGEKRIYFVLEALALQSVIFYKFLEEKDSLVKEGNDYIIKMDDTNIIGIIIILKLLTYKEDTTIDSDNVERVAFTAKKWKFEMILTLCEEHFIKNLGENYTKMSLLAHHYDMSQLQHILAQKQDEISQRLLDHETRIADENGYTPPQQPHIPRQDRYSEYITAEKFEFPEMRSKYTQKNSLKFKTGDRELTQLFNWIIEWKIKWKYNNHGSVFLTIGPSLGDAARVFKGLNWTLNFVLNVTFNGKEFKFPTTCKPSRKYYTYTVGKNLENVKTSCYDYSFKIELKCMKGMRYLVDFSRVHSYWVRRASSDVVLKSGKTKLFANVNILALHSDFFRGMLDHLEMQTIDPEENLPVVTVETADSQTVMRVLNYAYNVNRTSIEPKYLMEIIPFADFYLFNRLLNQCEKYLIDAEHYPKGILTLDYALEYNLHSFKEAYLRQFKSVFDIHKLKGDPNYKELSNEARLLLFDTMMELSPV